MRLKRAFSFGGNGFDDGMVMAMRSGNVFSQTKSTKGRKKGRQKAEKLFEKIGFFNAKHFVNSDVAPTPNSSSSCFGSFFLVQKKNFTCQIDNPTIFHQILPKSRFFAITVNVIESLLGSQRLVTIDIKLMYE